MENKQLFTMLEQYAEAGKNVSAFLNDYGTLAASDKTSLGLNKWDKNDKPTMEDFNEDNRILDEAIVGLGTEVAKKAEKAEVEVQLANKANKIPPQKHDLPLADDMEYRYFDCSYYKSETNEVTIIGNIGKSVGKIQDGDVLFYLPIGFRPGKAIEIPAMFYGDFANGYIQVQPDGKGIARYDTNNCTIVAFTLTFLAQ